MKRLLLILFGFIVLTSGNPIENCCYKTNSGKTIPLYGRVKFVESNADFRIEIVKVHADIKIQFVDSFADECGEWQIVQSNEDFRVEIVPSNADFRVQYVSNYPGVD